MNAKYKNLYQEIVSRDMTNLDEDLFYNEYSTNDEKFGNLYSYLEENNLTSLDPETFKSEYFGANTVEKKNPDVTELPSETGSSERFTDQTTKDPVRDSWKRLESDKWFGFNEELKQFTEGKNKGKDFAFRSPGDDWWGYSEKQHKTIATPIKDHTKKKTSEIYTNFPGKGNKEYEFKVSDGVAHWYEANPKKASALAELNAAKNATRPGPMGHGTMPVYSPEQIKKKEAEYKKIAEKIIIEDDGRVRALNNHFGKIASLDPIDQVYTNYDEEKKDNEYRINDGNWQRKVPGATSWTTVTDEGAVSALNRRYSKEVKYKPELKSVKQEPKLEFSGINTSLVSKTEEDAVTILSKNYGKYGFTFEQSGYGTDYIIAYNKDKTKQITVGFDEANPEEALKLKSFLEQNASKENSYAYYKIKEKRDVTKDFENISAYDSEKMKQSKENKEKQLYNYLNSKEYNNDLKLLSYDEIKDEIGNRILEITRSEGDINKFYNSDAYQIFKEKKKEEFGARDERIDLLYTELQSAKLPADIKKIKSKISAYLTEDVIQDQVKNYSMQLNDLDKSAKILALDQKEYLKSVENFNKQSGQMTQAEFDIGKKNLEDQAEKLGTRADFLMSSGKSIQDDQKKLNIVAGKYVAELSKSGGFFGGIMNSVLTGISKSIIEVPVSLVASFESSKKNYYDRMLPEEKQYYKDKGYSENDTKNIIANERIKDLKQKSRESLISVAGADQTTQEFIETQGFFAKAIFGVAESTPALLTGLGGYAASFGTLASQAYSSIEDLMLSDSDFETSSAGDRAVVAVPYAILMGVLENFGLKNVVKGSSFTGGIVKDILINSIKQMPKNSTKEALESIMGNEIKNLIGKGAFKIVNGAIAEFETGATQSLVLDVGLKALYNEISQSGMTEEQISNLSGGEMFDTPETLGELTSTVLEDGFAEAIGGATMSTFTTIASGLKNGNISLYNEDDLNYLKEISQDSEFKKLIVANLKTEMLKGNLTKSEAQERLDAMNELSSVIQSIPDELSNKDQISAVNILSEKNRLTKEIQGKDPALVTAQTVRINEINEELKNISKNATKEDNIEQQEGTAEGGISEYQGTSEGQQEVGVSQGGQREATINEADSGDSTVASKVQQEELESVNNRILKIEAAAARGELLEDSKPGELKKLKDRKKELESTPEAKIEKRRQEEIKNTGIELGNTETSNFNQGLKELRTDIVKKLFGRERLKAQKKLKLLANSNLSLLEIAKKLKEEFEVTISAGKSSLNEITINNINAKYDAELAALGTTQKPDQVAPKTQVNKLTEGFKQAGEKSRDTKDASHIGRWMLGNSQKGDVIKFQDGGYEVTEITTKKDGTNELVLTPFEFNEDGTKEYNNSGIKIITEQSIKNGSNLFENAYTNSKGERVIEQSIYEPQEVTVGQTTQQKQVATLRAEEQAELLKAIPKIESYKVNGEVDKTLMPKTVLAKYNKIYDKYDNLISPLLETVVKAEVTPGTRAVVSGIEIVYPTEEQKAERTEDRSTAQFVEEASKDLPIEDIDILSEELNGEFGMLTAENPLAQPLTDQENKSLNQKAIQWLESRGYKPRRATGKYDQGENSFFVPNLSKEDAIAFAIEFNQESVAHSEGLVYQDGSMNPRDKSGDDFSFSEYNPESNFVSVIRTPDGLKTFSIGYNFDNKIPASKEGPTVEQEVEAIGQLLSGTDAQIDQKASMIVNKKIYKAVSRAAKALSRIIPGTKFIVHDTDESYRAATKEEGLKQSSNGEFNAKTNTIHINGTSANARTVAHEVFHAILINKVKTDANAAAVTKRMVQAIASKINNNPELKKKLENFISNYEENIQDEEKLAELVGMLSENYNSFSTSIKDIIARWIDKLANIFGLDPFNRNETYDMLNTIARKVAKGEVISEVDVQIIEDVDNGESFESQYINANGTVVITPSNRKSKVAGTVVSESDLVDPKTLVGKPLEVFYYDNFTSSPYELKNRISGSSIKRVGEGGPGYSYRPEIKKAGIIAAFTNVTKVLNSIQGIRSRNDVAKDSALVGVALQNKETGHLGNKTTEKDFYSPSEGVIAQAINDKLLTENEAVEMLRGAVDAYAATSKGSDPKSSLGFTSNDFSTLDDFYKKIGAVSFERRGTFNAIAIPSKADLKITKATKPYVVTWLNSGIPTLKEYFNDTTEQYTKEAEAHDIVKYLDPELDKIGVDSSVTISEAEKNRAKSMGVEIVTISDDLIHTSYPVVMFGKNIGVPTTFHSVRDMSKDWAVPNPFFKAGRRSDKATPIIIPEIKANEKKPATTRKQLPQKTTQETRMDNEAEAIFKKSLDRGVAWNTAIQNVIDYIQISKWYEEASDIDREQKIRDFRQSKKQKLKKAPSVDKIMGTPKPSMVTVKEKTALKDQIKLEARAAREAKVDLNQKRKLLSTAIKGLVKLGKLNTKQAGIIIERAGYVNLDNQAMVDRLAEYAAKVFEKADYQDRLSRAFSFRKGIRKLLKGDIQAEVVGMAKKFSKIDPSMVDDIEKYLEMAEIVKNAIRPSRVNRKDGDVNMRESMNIDSVSEFTNDAIENQEAILKEELLAVHSELVEAGVIDKSMSLRDIESIISTIKEKEEADTPEEEEKIREFLSNRIDTMSTTIKDIIRYNINPMTFENVALTEKNRDLMSRMLNIDINNLSIKETIFIAEAMDNFINNNITSSVEAVIEKQEGATELENLIADKVVASPLRKYFINKVGQYMSEQIASMPILFEKLFVGAKNGLMVAKKMGWTALTNGVNKAEKMFNTTVDVYFKQYSKTKPNGKSFNDAENVYERGMLAFLSRNVSGTVTQQAEEFKRRVEVLKESVKSLLEGSSREQKMGVLYQKIYDKLNVDSRDIDIISANVDKINRSAVGWWINQWGTTYNDLADISLSVYNTMLSSDTSYSTDRYKLLDKVKRKEIIEPKNVGAFGRDIEFLDKNKTGVLIESNRPSASKVSKASRYVSLDFDVNNTSAYKGALIDINTAAAIRRIDGFINSDNLAKLIPTKEDRDIFTGRIADYIQAAKNKRVGPSDTSGYLDQLTNFLGGIGVGKALGGIDQIVKQTLPIALSTFTNSGRLDILNPASNAWIDSLGMAISNRGQESQSTIESIDRRLDKANSGAKVVSNFIVDAQQIWLKWCLSKPDIFIAKSSFISYYKQYLSNNNQSTDIDWATHNVNQDAADYAMLMVDRQQNVSDAKMAGKAFSSQNSTTKVMRKIFLPFASFSLNQKSRMVSDIKVLGINSGASKQDKIIAARSLLSLPLEMLLYQSIGLAIRLGYLAIAKGIIGAVADDDDEEKEKLLGMEMSKEMKNATKYPLKSMVTDFLSPIAIADHAVVGGANYLLSQLSVDQDMIDEAVSKKNIMLKASGKEKMNDKEKQNFIEKYKEDHEYQLFNDEKKSYGTIGIGGDTYKELIDNMNTAYTGKYTQDYMGNESERFLLPKDQDNIKNAVIFETLFALGILPRDVNTVTNNIIKLSKKNSLTENQFEKYKAVGKETGGKVTGWKMDLVESKSKTESTLEELEWIKGYGGLTEKQGQEYVKLKKLIVGHVSYTQLMDLKSGMTADKIIKSY